MSSKVCRAPIEAVSRMCSNIPNLVPGDGLVFTFAVYKVGIPLDLKDVDRNHRYFDVEAKLGSMNIADQLVQGLEKQVLKPREELAISNVVTVFGTNYFDQPFNMAFIDYKSDDYQTVKSAMGKSARFDRGALFRTDASFHAYGRPMRASESHTNETVAKTVLTQRNVIDVDWAMICILRGQSFLRVTQNFKGNIVPATGATRIRLDSGVRKRTVSKSDYFDSREFRKRPVPLEEIPF